jgi:hypothetical protein
LQPVLSPLQAWPLRSIGLFGGTGRGAISSSPQVQVIRKMDDQHAARFESQHASVKPASIRAVLAAVFFCCTFFVGCRSERRNLNLAEEAVEQFHSQFNSGQYVAIYEAAGYPLKEGTSKPNFVQFLRGVREKLGAEQASVPGGTTFQLAQRTIRIEYFTTFASGTGREQFVWEFSDNHAILDTYSIDSKGLAAK